MKKYAIPAVVAAVALLILVDGMLDIIALAALVGAFLYVKSPQTLENAKSGVKRGNTKQPSTW